MIGCFPDPYPDELLYSICARYHDRMMYFNSGYMTIQELFGSNSGVTIDLPTRLAYLTTALPPGHRYTVDYLIDRHTLFPFYSPFLTIERVERIRSDMQGNDGSAIHKIAGITPSSIRMPNRLRYCLFCAESDKKKYGEFYWHRLHQLPGIEVCPIHEVFLEESNIPMRNRLNTQVLVSAERGVSETSPRLLNLSISDHQVLLKIAQDAIWLLEQRRLVPGFSVLRNCYLRLLTDVGLASENKVYVSKLLNTFKNYYSFDLLKQLQCEVDEQKPSVWLARLHKDFGLSKTNHPLRHLLLIQFLGRTAEEFFEDCTSKNSSNSVVNSMAKAFGEGPWPCLNPTCQFFQKFQINECQINFIYAKEHERKPYGSFNCVCGFTYGRKGPDTSPKDQFRLDTIKSYGDTWDKTLKELWEDSSLSMREIARRLNSYHTTIKRQACCLGLQFPRKGRGKGARFTQSDFKVTSKARKNQTVDQKELKSCRAEWLRAQGENPNATKRSLRDEHSRTYRWLYQHDKEWLQAHTRPSPNGVGSLRQGQVDWASRDTHLANLVRQSAIRIRGATGKPKRVTVSAISYDLDKRTILDRQLDKLPMTARALKEVVETREEFAIRRIEWATNLFLQNNINPAWSQLLLQASVYELKDVPAVKEAINTALETLATLNSK
ncbi:TniQ family protein [Cyanobacteria bacterium FACHB-63]|nr:TniQ family protein [Cyanobacteria bacterium FACHB-63]